MADVTVEGSLSAGSEYRARRWKVATTADVIYEFFTTGASADLKYRKSTDGGATWGAAVTIYSTNDVFSFDVYYDKWAPNGTGTKIHIVWLDYGDAIRYRSLDTASDTLGTQRNVKTGTPLYSDPPDPQSAHLSFSLAENGDLRVYFQFDNGPDNGNYKSTAASAGASWTSRTTFYQSDYNDLFMLFPASGATDDIAVLWWDESASEVKVFIHDDSANTNGSAVSVGTSLNFDISGTAYWQWSAQVRHSDGHIILAVRNELGSTGDIRVFDITPSATPSVSELTTVLSNTAGAGVDVFIDQNTDDIYIAWLQGTLAATTDVYYSISTDNGSTWGTAVGPVNETAADDYRNLCSNGMVLSGDAGRYALSWVNDDTDDLMTNKVNSVSISAGGSGMTGTIAATITKATAALAGTKSYTGTAAATLQKLTAALSGYMQPSGAVAATLQAATGSAAGTQTQTGTIAATLSKATAAAAGTQAQTGTVAATLSMATASASGAMQPSGAVAATLTKATAALAGTHTGTSPEGTAAATLQAVTAALAGTQTQTGAAATSLQPATAALTGTQQFIGQVAATLQVATAALAGTHSQTGSLAATLQILTVALLGSQTQTGTIAATLQAATAALAETVAAATPTSIPMTGSYSPSIAMTGSLLAANTGSYSHPAMTGSVGD